jgi:hypothetical protein
MALDRHGRGPGSATTCTNCQIMFRGEEEQKGALSGCRVEHTAAIRQYVEDWDWETQFAALG